MELINLALKSIFVENMALAFFLGMCSFLLTVAAEIAPSSVTRPHCSGPRLQSFP